MPGSALTARLRPQARRQVVLPGDPVEPDQQVLGRQSGGLRVPPFFLLAADRIGLAFLFRLQQLEVRRQLARRGLERRRYGFCLRQAPAFGRNALPAACGWRRLPAVS